MLTDKELEMFREKLGNDFPMFSEWEKKKLMDIAEHGSGGLIKALTYFAEARLKQGQAEKNCADRAKHSVYPLQQHRKGEHGAKYA